MDIKHLVYFAALAREKSYSRASEKLGITQPTLTQSVQKLESVLGAPLFDRSFPGLTLSEEGAVFLEACRKIMDVYDQAVKRITELNNGITGTVRVGIAPFRAQYAIAGWLRDFHEKYPNVRLVFEELVTEELFPALDTGELDLALTAAESKPSTKYESIPVATEEVLVALHRDLAEANEALAAASRSGGVPEVDFSAFSGTDFILLGEEQLLYKHFKALSRESGTQIRSVTRCTGIETSLSLANAGAGAAFILSSGLPYYRDRYPNLCYFSVRSRTPGRTVYVIFRKNQYLSNPAKYVIELMGGHRFDPCD